MIYVEEEILNHPRALQIQERFPDSIWAKRQP